jgi:hypothetical protein
MLAAYIEAFINSLSDEPIEVSEPETTKYELAS